MIHAAVLSGFVLAVFAPAIQRRWPKAGSWMLSLLPFGLAVLFASHIGEEPVRESTAWIPALGADLAFRLDGLGLVFALIISAVGAFVLIYAGGYLKGHRHLGRIQCFLLLFMASMLGVVLADNLVALFVFWELTSVTSYLLIGFDHEREKSRAAALQALLVTGFGGVAMLAGALLLQQITGTLSIEGVLGQGETIRAHALYVPALLLILLGAFTKSAQFPFHFWLPNAMEAPTPVSAYLHSATMVKAGIYLMARLSPALGGTDWWFGLLVTGGAVTMLAGAVLAFGKSDLKQILAYSTVSALGMLTFVLGIGGEAGARAAVVLLIAHSLYKGALFMAAGAVDHEAGTRMIEDLGGLRGAMPVTAAAALGAAVSMAGLPPLFGFIAKELFYEAAEVHPVLLACAVATGILTVGAAGLVAIRPFFGRAVQTLKHAHEAPSSLWLGPAALAAGGIVFGLFSGTAAGGLVAGAASSVAGIPVTAELGLLHGINLTLLLSAFTAVAGVALYASADRIRPLLRPVVGSLAWGPAGWYDALLASMMRFATFQTRLLQNGLLPHYLRVTLGMAILLIGVALVRGTGPPQKNLLTDVRLHEAVVGILILAGAFSSVRATSRLAAITSLGVVALGLAMTFVLFGAPDLAMTQFLVETLTVILLVLVIYKLPAYTQKSSDRTRLRDAIVSVIAGSLFTVLVLGVTSMQLAPEISDYYIENSEKLAHGRNIVNVILVDFRGLDTLGEITVLSIAAVGVYALLKLRPHKEEPS
ncbi:MAG: putative monovalent cation/H+ antiporter subunit A [Bryobacterales bacterium]|nr:putative monovalent cation/H+ antiporter subunit A [Bryobacterales bacterium]